MSEKNEKKSGSLNDWNGPIPAGSFMNISDYVCMSTPEFYFLRMANSNTLAKAVQIGMELCGKYCTNLTCPSESGYKFLKTSRTNTKTISEYLKKIEDTEEGKKALEVLGYVTDCSCTPVDTFLYMLAVLPESAGGVGLPKPEVSVAYRGESGFMPDSHGEYLAYDLCWRDESVVLQYIGNDEIPNKRDYEALSVNGMKVYTINERMLKYKSSIKYVFNALISSDVIGSSTEVGDEIIEMMGYLENVRLTHKDLSKYMH